MDTLEVTGYITFLDVVALKNKPDHQVDADGERRCSSLKMDGGQLSPAATTALTWHMVEAGRILSRPTIKRTPH